MYKDAIKYIYSKYKYLSKKERKIVQLMYQIHELDLLVRYDHLKPEFKTYGALRTFMNRLIKKGTVKPFGAKNNAYFVITEYYEYFLRTTPIFILFAENIEQKEALIQMQRNFFNTIKQSIHANTWTELLTHSVKVEFKIDGLYSSIKDFAHLPDNNNDFLIIRTAAVSSYTDIHIHSNDIISIQLNHPIRTSDLFETLNLARNQLVAIITYWNIGEYSIPLTSEWSASISNLHHDSINAKYIKQNNNIGNNLGASYYLQDFKLNDVNYLRLGIHFPKIQLKVKDIFDIFKRNDLLKVSSSCNNQCYIPVLHVQQNRRGF